MAMETRRFPSFSVGTRGGPGAVPNEKSSLLAAGENPLPSRGPWGGNPLRRQEVLQVAALGGWVAHKKGAWIKRQGAHSERLVGLLSMEPRAGG